MSTRFLALVSFLALAACSGESNGSLDDGNGKFVDEGEGTNTPAPPASASTPATKSNTSTPTKSSATPDAGPPAKNDTKDACDELAKCCETITRPVAKLACTAAAGSGQEQLCAPALKACEGDGGT